MITSACAICQREFETTPNRVYCGKACYQEAVRRQRRTPEQRERIARRQAAWRANNPEHARQVARQWVVEHPEKRLGYARARQERTPDYFKIMCRKWRETHSVERAQYDAQYHRMHKAEGNARRAAYRHAHPGFEQLVSSRRRARRWSAGGKWTQAQFLELCQACDWRCAYCHQHFDKLTPDHIQPLARGGSDDISNIIPACGPCNYSKHTKTPLEYLTRFTPPKTA